MNAPPEPPVAIHLPSGEMATAWRSPNPNLRSGCVTTSAREQIVKARQKPKSIFVNRILLIRDHRPRRHAGNGTEEGGPGVVKRDFSCLIYTAAGTILRLNNLTDQQLLRDYAEHRSEEIDLVYSAALRTGCSACRAEDVTQSTFICRKHTL